MFRESIIFLLLCFFGLLIQATLVHASFPSAVAPDLILLLVVVLALRHQSVLGVFGVFLLGATADFASGHFVGPQAGGAVMAFFLVTMLSGKIFLDHLVSFSFIVFICGLVKSLTMLLLISLYTNSPVFRTDVLKTVLYEALLTAVLAIIIGKLVHLSKYQARGSAFHGGYK